MQGILQFVALASVTFADTAVDCVKDNPDDNFLGLSFSFGEDLPPQPIEGNILTYSTSASEITCVAYNVICLEEGDNGWTLLS